MDIGYKKNKNKRDQSDGLRHLPRPMSHQVRVSGQYSSSTRMGIMATYRTALRLMLWFGMCAVLLVLVALVAPWFKTWLDLVLKTEFGIATYWTCFLFLIGLGIHA